MTEPCPHCNGNRYPKDADRTGVTWVCDDCGRTSREELISND